MLVGLRTQAYFRKVAEDALASAGVFEPPVPVTKIIESLGIPILPGESAALLHRRPPSTPTACRSWSSTTPSPSPLAEKPSRTCSSHLLLVLDDPSNVFPRDTGDHSDADMLAHELTMPATMVIDQSRLWFNDFRYLARLFGVGEAAMLERMRELGIVNNQQGIRWDY